MTETITPSPSAGSGSTGGPGEARIIDRGYRHYRGERTGVRGAQRTLVVHSVQRALGLRRTLWAKALPIATILIAYVPAIVFVGVIALVPIDELEVGFLPSYGEYYGFIIAAIMIFVSLAAPEVLCTDRRTGMLGVYLSSPLDRDSYLAAKGAAIAGVLSLVCLGPPLLMLVANVLQNTGPDGAADIALTFLRVLAAGLALTLLYTAVTMGVASLTDRKSVAAAGIILLFLVSIMVAGTMIQATGSDDPGVLSVTVLSLELAARIHGEAGTELRGASDFVIWGAWAAWTIGGFALARYRLHRLPVTR